MIKFFVIYQRGNFYMKTILLTFVLALFFSSCVKVEETTSADIQETAQQVGDVMASIDEAGRRSGSLAYNQKLIKEKSLNSFARYAPLSLSENIMSKLFLLKANATACADTGFATCNTTTDTIVRSFAGCTVGSAVFSGDVTLTWGSGGATHADCSLGSTAGAYITRVPNFTVTGRRSAVLSVTKTGSVGQRITWSLGTGANKVFAFSNDGIRRSFVSGTTTLFDQTTATSGDITVTGTDRTNRVMNNGSLNVTNNLTSVVCNYVPTNVTWASSTCNCPTSGSWSGSCSDGKSTTLVITGCGTATYTEGETTESVSFDRCGT